MSNRFETRAIEIHEGKLQDRDDFIEQYRNPQEISPAPADYTKLYVIYNPDSIQAIHTADMVKRLIPMYRAGARHAKPFFDTDPGQRGMKVADYSKLSIRNQLKWKNLKAVCSTVKNKVYDIQLLNVQNAIVPDQKSAVFVWLGLEPRRNVAPEMSSSQWDNSRHITFSENPTLIYDESYIGKHVSDAYHEHNGWYTNGEEAMRNNGKALSTLKYGMMLEFLSRMDTMIHLSRVITDLRNSEVIEFFIQRQHLVSSFETPLIDKDNLEKSFVETVKAMRELRLPGSTINIDNPTEALATQIRSVRAQMQATGSVASAFRHKKAIHAYCTKLTEFFWVAKRLIRFEHQHYANITLCNTGVLMSSNLPSEYSLKVNTDLYRSK